jgi:hypothetical protein
VKFFVASKWLKILSGYLGPSPVKKHAQAKGFHTGEIITIINVYKILLKDGCHTTISDAARKVAFLTGMAMKSVFGILKVQLPQKNQPKRKSIINDSNVFVRAAIRRKMHGFYF